MTTSTRFWPWRAACSKTSTWSKRRSNSSTIWTSTCSTRTLHGASRRNRFRKLAPRENCQRDRDEERSASRTESPRSTVLAAVCPCSDHISGRHLLKQRKRRDRSLPSRWGRSFLFGHRSWETSELARKTTREARRRSAIRSTKCFGKLKGKQSPTKPSTATTAVTGYNTTIAFKFSNCYPSRQPNDKIKNVLSCHLE